MTAPTLPPPADVVDPVKACHDAELAAGNPQWAHLLDDDRPFYALAARSTYTTQDGAS